LILRREGERIKRYCHIGTGNYNSRTARNYEDFGLLTADEDIAEDVGELFNYLTGFARLDGFNKLLVSPVSMRSGIIDEIERQAALGPNGRIIIKCNGLTDRDSIDALYRASMAGVPIDLAIRGMCCLRPGVPGLSETITVRSIVGEFLEHSRVFAFGRHGVNDGVKVYIGSADLMERNLDRRIEAAAPITDPVLIAKVLHILELVLSDDTNTWLLGPDQRWRRLVGRSENSLHLKLRIEALETYRQAENA
jgi:polyphosphate kinase